MRVRLGQFRAATFAALVHGASALPWAPWVDPARGLRTILENVLLDTMYDLPSQEGVSKVVIDEAVINGDTPPYLVYEGGDSKNQYEEDDEAKPLGRENSQG